MNQGDNMEELIKLKSELSTYHPKHNEYDAKIADRILDLVDALPSSTDELPPPLEIFVYAIQNILNPQPLYSQISDLLRLLTMVEFWRLRAMSIISSALVYQTYYKGMADPYLFLLPVDVELEFKSCEESSETWRECFIQIVSGCTETHMQRLWLTRSNTEFWAQWNEYFSNLEKVSIPTDGDKEPSEITHTFHYRLSTNDIETLLQPIKNCVDFIDATLRSAEDQQRSSGESFDQTPNSEEFYKEFDLPIFKDGLRVMIDDYLEFVSTLVRDVHQVFPVEFPLP